MLTRATAAGYTQQPTDKNGLAGVTSLTDGKVLGLFNSGTLTPEFKPLFARTAAFYTANSPVPGGTPGGGSGSVNDANTQGGSAGTRCDETQRSATNEPSLPVMTQKAIDLLSTKPGAEGFTLQVEGASIDKRDHAADVCGQIGETIAFDDAIGVALAYQAQHPETLILMTADHAHSSQIINATATPASGSAFATLNTVDNSPIRVSYGTSDTGLGATTSGSQTHTGAEVPLWGSGPQAANVVGTLDETDIFSILNGKEPSKLPTKTVTETNTVTTPAATTPGASMVDRSPRLGVAAIRSISAKALATAGLPVAITRLNIASVKLTLSRAGRTVLTRTLESSATTALKVKGARRGTYRLTVSGGGQKNVYAISVR